MATITSANPANAAGKDLSAPGLLSEIHTFWKQFFVAAFDPYRPELHYMRGPGPACRAKSLSNARSSVEAPSPSR
jgi:hypothetical protein